MGLFTKPHTEATPETPEPVRTARSVLSEAATALATHDNEAARLIRLLEESTSALDSATLADDQREIERAIRDRFDLQQRIESLGRVRPHRLSQLEDAQRTLRAAERAAASEQQKHLIEAKAALNQQIIKSAQALAALIEEGVKVQTEISQLADTCQLNRPAMRWLLPADFIRSKAGAALHAATDPTRVYGVEGASQIADDETSSDEVTDEELMAIAGQVAQEAA